MKASAASLCCANKQHQNEQPAINGGDAAIGRGGGRLDKLRVSQAQNIVTLAIADKRDARLKTSRRVRTGRNAPAVSNDKHRRA